NGEPQTRRSDDLAGLRAYLVADLIRRTAARHRLLVTGDRDADTGRPDAADRAALNMHPPEYPTGAAAGLTIDVQPHDARPAGSADRAGGGSILARTAAARRGDAQVDNCVLAAVAGRAMAPLAL